MGTLKLMFISLAVLFAGVNCGSSSKREVVSVTDVDNFWVAYDSIRSTNDSIRQLGYIKKLYIDKGTEGLKAFMDARDYDAELWVKLIRQYPKFWNSIRPNTLTVKNFDKQIEEKIARLKKLYPALKPAKIYFTVGGLRSGGTTMEDGVLIGTEIATGDASTDVSEFDDRWLAEIFKIQNKDNIVPLNIHEYVHTQQKNEATDLLGAAICEGACDFITELVMAKPETDNYLRNGKRLEPVMKEKFRQEMFANYYNNWLYNGSFNDTTSDLGYYMGYMICKNYYEKSADKKQAVKEIIELDFADQARVEAFLLASKYYTDPPDRKRLLQEFEAKRPYVKNSMPHIDSSTLVDPRISELRIEFSEAMNTKAKMVKMGSLGKDFYPVTGKPVYSDNGKTLIVKLDLKPGKKYEFEVSDEGFSQSSGHPLKPIKFSFRTRE